MAMGTDSLGNAPIERTDAQSGGIERTVEFIAQPSRHSDGSVTHRPDAKLGYNPDDIEPIVDPKPEPVEQSADFGHEVGSSIDPTVTPTV